MGTHTSEVILKFKDQFSSGFDKTLQRLKSGTVFTKKTINSLNSAGDTMLRTGTMLFAPLAVGIRQCIAAEMDYENAIAKVKTIADESQKPMETIGKEMRDISKTYGQDIGDVADTFYNVISATVDTANAIDYVHVASKMAIGGFAEMNTAVGGLTAVMAGYSKQGYDMYRVGDLLAQTQVYGKTTIDELSQTLGTVTPFSSQVGMSLEDLSTIMAVLTSNGLDTATATVGLKNAITSILSPTSSAVKQFEKFNLSYGSKAFSEMDFGSYLDNLKKAVGLTKEAEEELKKLKADESVTDEQLTEFYKNAGVNIDNLLTMFGNIRGATAMLSLTGSIDKYHQFRTQMNEENSKGVLEKQANIMLSAPQQQFKILKQNFTDSLRLFGEKLMPKVNELLGHATNMLNKLNSMSDEQISQIVDNVIKVAAFGATLIAIGTACKALASILSLVNLIWGGVSKLAGIKLVGDALKGAGGAAAGAGAAKAAGGAGLFGKVGAGLSAAGGKLLAGASAAGKFLLGKALPAVIGFKIGMDLSETKIGNDSLFKEGEPIYYYDNVDDMRAQMRPEVRERFELMDKLQKENNEKRKQQELENQNKPAYQTYDLKTNKFTNVYISNVDVNGVENLDNMISEIENAADSMR